MSLEQPGLTPTEGTAPGARERPVVDAPTAAERAPVAPLRPTAVPSMASVPGPDVAAVSTGTQKRAPARRRVRARKAHRVVRHIDPWSVLKVSLLFYFSLFCILVVAGLVLWQAGQATGVLEDFEGFVADLGSYETWELDGGQLFQASVLGGLVLVIAGSAANVLLAVLFNLISDVTGGLRVTVLEEEPRRSQNPASPATGGSPPTG